ncbi:hypothetical protein ACFQY4_35485 [Catellatospora bangladeshensis]|nr:hypothetical protein [Catellatospora bangladeshensis]
MDALGLLRAEFGWGLLVLADRDSDRKVPGPGLPAQLVLPGADAAVVKVRHAQTGETVVRIWAEGTDRGSLQPVELGGCSIQIPSGVLVVSDVEGADSATVPLEPGMYALTVLGDAVVEAALVDVLLERA